MKGKQIRKILEKDGWILDRITGSHHIFKKEGFEYSMNVPIHGKKELNPGIARDILKKAELLHYWKGNKGRKK